MAPRLPPDALPPSRPTHLVPHTYTIDAERACACVRLAGRIGRPHILAAHHDLHADPAWHPRLRVLWDLSGITELSLLPADVEALLCAFREEPRCVGRAAILAPRDVLYAISALIAHRLSSHEVGVFHSPHAAAEWLGAPVPATAARAGAGRPSGYAIAQPLRVGDRPAA